MCLQSLRTGCPDYLEYYCNELGSLSIFFFFCFFALCQLQKLKRTSRQWKEYQIMFSFQCQPERYYGFQSQNQHLFTFLSLDSSSSFTLQTEPKTAASSIRLLMNSNVSTAFQLFAGVHTATGGQDSSFNSMACTFSCELRWSCWFPHFSCSVHNSPQILRQVPPGTWWWCGPPGGGEKQSSVHRAVTTTTTRQTRSTLTM